VPENDKPATTWKQVLGSRMPADWANEIDVYEGQLQLRKQGKLDEKVFAETRLRRGSYGQRYDNGQRHDGVQQRTLPYADKPTKGHETMWDAPGMSRIKIPYGGWSPEQMETIAALAEEYSDAILHVTTRQDIQLHYVHIEDTPDLMRRLASVGVTTREACGNSVRNITACPLAGICRTEAFDVSPYASAMMRFLLGHPDVQDFGRKFKPAFSGCEHEACGLVNLHDAGYIAQMRDGKRGFKVFIGGGLGAVPHSAKVLSEFTPEEELLPQIQAVARVFARLGEKKNRNRARIKFLVAKLGIDEFRRLVEEERQILPHDPRWTAYIHDMPRTQGEPARPPQPLTTHNGQNPAGFAEWYRTNLYKQRQDGYYTVTINLPLGDITSDQTRALADIARKYVGDNIRTTVEQNMVLRFVSEADLPALYADLKATGLAAAGASTITDVVSCPGTDTCKLGIASSRGLGGELREHLLKKNGKLDPAIEGLHIKTSGCFNSCGQHHVADIGFFGNSRKAGGYAVPHFQLVLGGEWKNNAGNYGLAVGAVPSKAIPALLDALIEKYLQEREDGEVFRDWVGRLGKKEIRAFIEPYMKVPDYADDPSYYTDWGDPREFGIGDMGTGECAGELVSLFAIEIVKADSLAFEAQVALEENDYTRADALAYQAMLTAARSLIRSSFIDITEDPDYIVSEFRKRFVDTKVFFDKYMGNQFAGYLLLRHEAAPERLDQDHAHRIVEEAQLFIEACYACDARMSSAAVADDAFSLV
jgi:sulfite reductase (ferredoxin)